MAKIKKSKKSAKKSAKMDPLGPTAPVERPAYNAAIELCAIRKMALKEALQEFYGIGREN
jgi:hypothetical protein